MAVQAVLFDIGGVLIHANLELYADYGSKIFKCTPENLRAAAQPRVPKLEKGEITSDEFWKEVGEVLWSKGQGTLPEPIQLRGLWKQLMKDSLKLDEQVLKLCWNLRAKVAVGALSNTIKEHAEYLHELGYYQPFRPCVLSCLVGQRKPDKAVYVLAAKQTGKAIGKCLLIDDSELNCQAARAAGMKAHHFTGLYPLVSELGKHKLL